MYDVILVLGYAVDKKGRNHEEQTLRVNRGVDLLKRGRAKYLLMSGGFGHFNQTKRSLATHMKSFAVRRGVSPQKVFTESKSQETIENLLFSRKIIEKHSWKSVIIVSSTAHMPRIKMICGYVLGKRFKLKFVGVNTQSESAKRYMKKEKGYMQENRERLEANFKEKE